MRLVFLGTSAGAPTRQRNVTSHALHLDDGSLWLCDCGEATQHRLAACGLRAKAVAGVLLTHLHGDHCYGLPGLLSALAIAGREAPVAIAGPAGVRQWLDATLAMSDARLPFAVTVRELAADREAVPFAPGWDALAIRIAHRIPCWGYRLREPPRLRRLDAVQAEALGVPPPLRRRLVRGEAVDLPDGRRIHPDDCCGPSLPGRLIGLLGDTDDADAMIPELRGADLIVREATYAADRTAQARQWGHSTTAMTGAFAAACAARTLAVTHLSARYTLPGDPGAADLAQLAAEVAAACPGVRVIMADDGLAIPI